MFNTTVVDGTAIIEENDSGAYTITYYPPETTQLIVARELFEELIAKAHQFDQTIKDHS